MPSGGERMYIEMKTKSKWFTAILVVLLCVLLVAGTAAIASQVWDRDEPYVSFSYITDELEPKLLETVNQAVDEKLKTVNDALDASLTQYQNKVSEKLNNDTTFLQDVADLVAQKLGSDTVGGYAKVVIPEGKTLKGKVGTEIMTRLGDSTCVSGGDVGLVDLTDGGILSNGEALSQNHLYMFTIEDRGVKAVDEVTAFVSGGYTLED